MEITIYCSFCEQRTPHEQETIEINEYETMLLWKCSCCTNGRSTLVRPHKHLKPIKNEKENYGTSK